ncbi:MAG: hypothetical protein IIB63_03195, partial [Proteobacteria bacterium]|nr:hypothetical protein [Pseudomonadota bacterium]
MPGAAPGGRETGIAWALRGLSLAFHGGVIAAAVAVAGPQPAQVIEAYTVEIVFSDRVAGGHGEGTEQFTSQSVDAFLFQWRNARQNVSGIPHVGDPAKGGHERSALRVPSGEKIAAVDVAVADLHQPLANGCDQLRVGRLLGTRQCADARAGDGLCLNEQIVDFSQSVVGRTEHQIRVKQVVENLVLLL